MIAIALYSALTPEEHRMIDIEREKRRWLDRTERWRAALVRAGYGDLWTSRLEQHLPSNRGKTVDFPLVSEGHHT